MNNISRLFAFVSCLGTKFGKIMMVHNIHFQMIYTQLRVFALFFSLLLLKATALTGQVVDVHFTFDPNQNDLEVVIGEIEIQSKWTGIEILSSHDVWELAGESVEDFAIDETTNQTWRVVRGSNTGQWFAQFRSPRFRVTQNGAVEKLMSWDGVIGSSPAPESRVVRLWPEHSMLSEGKWLKFATGQEGVFRIGYSDLVSSGINPDTLLFSQMQLYGNGGRMLPLENDVDRPLDLPLLKIETQGEQDGVFNSEDAIFFHASGVDSWKWSGSLQRLEHEKHNWSDSAYYYLRIDGPANLLGSRVDTPTANNLPVAQEFSKHMARSFHEVESYNIAQSGREFYGEQFTYLGSQIYGFSFNMPNLVGDTGWVDARVAGRTLGSTSDFTLLCNGEESQTTDISLSESSLLLAQKRVLSLEVEMPGDGVDVQLSFTPGNESAQGWIDYVRVQAWQNLVVSSGQFYINGTRIDAVSNSARYTLDNAASVDAVWDVTNPLESINVDVEALGTELAFKAQMDTTRRFVAFRYNAAKEVRALGPVENTDLHGLGPLDLVILTALPLDSAARRLAILHADRGLRVAVVNQRQVFKAFSSGSPDPTAIKMLMMMLRDRALTTEDEPRYLTLMGDGTFLNRNLNPDGINLITFQSSNSESTVNSYVTDDYFGLLEDGMGESPGDKLAIGVGRIPATGLSQALGFVSKVETYLGASLESSPSAECEAGGESSVFGSWRNRIVFVTDDQDGNNNDGWRHMSDSEIHSSRVSQEHNEYDIIKIYPDSYIQEATPGGERYDAAEAEIARKVQEGALIIDYIGHGGARGWAHERILNTTTIREWTNKKRLPVFMTATCELSRYDDPEVESAGEMLIFNPDGGSVGMLTTTRTVFSGGNQELNTAFFKTVLDEDSGTGQRRCLGDICKDTKNSPDVTSLTNMRNFSLLGDPAMMLAYPEHNIFFTQIPDTIRSLDLVKMTGYVGTTSGDTLEEFNGQIYPTVFDKRSELSTLDNDAVAGEFNYTMYRNVIHKGLASVVNGIFEFEFVVPRDIDYTYGNGRVSCYAISENNEAKTDAHGASESFVIGGTSPSVSIDDLGPEVSLYINDSLFVAGGVTGEDPWLYARVYDESGINTVGNGIGHDLKAVLDESYDSPYVLNTYFTADLDTYKSGTVRFPFSDLEDGEHLLEFKVWDVQNNSATALTSFLVVNSLNVALESVIAYPNPASSHVSFRVEHNQVCQLVEAEVEVYDASGRQVKVFTKDLVSHGSLTDVASWNLIDGSGADVPAGIYLFKIKITTENGTYAQYGSKLVVVRP